MLTLMGLTSPKSDSSQKIVNLIKFSVCCFAKPCAPESWVKYSRESSRSAALNLQHLSPPSCYWHAFAENKKLGF